MVLDQFSKGKNSIYFTLVQNFNFEKKNYCNKKPKETFPNLELSVEQATNFIKI